LTRSARGMECVWASINIFLLLNLPPKIPFHQQLL
jgi:hypothetical protein